MKTSKIVAIAIFLFIFFVPFRMLFFSDDIIDSGKHIMLLMTTLIGFFIAFGIGTNEPFDKRTRNEAVSSADQAEEKRKAA